MLLIIVLRARQLFHWQTDHLRGNFPANRANARASRPLYSTGHVMLCMRARHRPQLMHRLLAFERAKAR